MKYLFLLSVLCSAQAFCQINLYDQRLSSLDGQTISMADFKGVKILIASVSPDQLKNGRMRFLDSLQAAFPKVKFIVIPAGDFGGKEDAQILTNVKNRPAKSADVIEASSVKKTSGVKQHILMKWLTDVASNKHFSTEVRTDDQLYVVSESGILYAKLEKGVPLKIVEEVLNQEDVKQ